MIARARDHLSALWPSGFFWPTLPFFAYAAYVAARGTLRVDHVVLCAIAACLAYGSTRTKALYVGILPLGLVAVMYDAMRPFKDLGLTEERVLSCQVRDVEATLFGAHGRTLHDVFLAHHRPALDVFAAIPYATFVFVCVACAVWLYMRDRQAMIRFALGFFVLNALGFATYHLLPAAPPWYVHAKGCMVDLATPASEGAALARVDAMLGISYFRAMYARSSSVFGAIPSLHCAYPVLVGIEGWRSFGPKLKVASVAYAAAMVFSAIYLDHHWVLDAVVGISYAVLVSVILRKLMRSRVVAQEVAA